MKAFETDTTNNSPLHMNVKKQNPRPGHKLGIIFFQHRFPDTAFSAVFVSESSTCKAQDALNEKRKIKNMAEVFEHEIPPPGARVRIGYRRICEKEAG